MIANVLAYATTGPHRARAQSAVADGTPARNRTLRVHGINATCVTAHKPPFPNSRIMRLVSISQSMTKFPPEQRIDHNGMIQSHARSSTSTSTSTSTKNSQNKTMHRIGRSAAFNFRNSFGGHSVMVAVPRSCLFSSRKETSCSHVFLLHFCQLSQSFFFALECYSPKRIPSWRICIGSQLFSRVRSNC